MAYVLGFFAADGNMIRGKRGNHYISFYSCNRELLEKVRKIMGCDHKIYGKIPRNKKHQICYQIQIGSKELFADLIRLGFTPHKSLNQKGFRLTFSNRDSLRLYTFLYKHLKNSLYLPRKKKVFEKFIALRA